LTNTYRNRLAFFAISNNVVILALRGMIVEFIFFILIAAICFSGLLFTLWELGRVCLLPNRRAELCYIAGGTWTVKNTTWLMIQIWFGNTALSFNQASSFHPVFVRASRFSVLVPPANASQGPPLMVIYAALSNTLLITSRLSTRSCVI
jgi:hypothetical protein